MTARYVDLFGEWEIVLNVGAHLEGQDCRAWNTLNALTEVGIDAAGGFLLVGRRSGTGLAARGRVLAYCPACGVHLARLVRERYGGGGSW